MKEKQDRERERSCQESAFNAATILSRGGTRQTVWLIQASYLLHRLHGRGRVLIAAEVDDGPRDVAQKGDGDGGVNERQQWLDHTQGDDIVPALWPITWTVKVQRSLNVKLNRLVCKGN